MTGAALTTDAKGVPCFVRGSRIATNRGLIPIELLRAGDLAQTRDNGLQAILWIGSCRVPARGRLAPIRLAPGALGNSRPLLVSPNHRVLLVGWRAELLLGEHEVLQPAKWLLALPGVRQVAGGMVQYFHLLFERHEILLCEDTWSESFHPGHSALTTFKAAARREVLALFPDLADLTNPGRYGPVARLVPPASAGKLLARFWRADA